MTEASERAAKFLAWRKKKEEAAELAQSTNGEVLDVLEFIEQRTKERGRFGDEG